ncbi:hypothetical protein F4810DRAFT_153074 [Camillea tinctor]|nr:hypothetical protein F4810DRAFT_153074 [Camillea tinctor]
MQVLNSPTREEVNAAHFSGTWLGIGIPSVRNAFRVSKFKTICWILLLFSSIPIHLVFNSTIFETDHRESDFHLTIANEDFVHGGTYYPPGSSLALPGIVAADAERIASGNISHYSTYYLGSGLGYGVSVNGSDYDNKESPVVTNISATAANAANWDRLDVNECLAQYVDCSGLKKYRDVVLVTNNTGGWVRDTIWHLMDNETAFWDRYVPGDSANSLFFDSQCTMAAESQNGQRTSCFNACYEAFGTYRDIDYYNVGWNYPFFGKNGVLTWVNRSLVEEDGMPPDNSFYMTTSGLQPGTYNISVSYCLAQPMENICHIALSPVLLASVTACVIVKTLTAVVVTAVLGRRNQDPLVTLGDAIASFIERPDRVTAGLCTMGQAEIRRAMRSRRAFLVPGPRPWTAAKHRRASAVPVLVWITSYLLFFVGIGISAGLFDMALQTNGLSGGFFEGDGNSFIPVAFTLTQAVLLANSPQLLLSFCYLAYNLFTRLQMAREWALFSNGYHPLRVTNPRGKQYSTYRLQLPYKYSIPLIAVSIFLHWLLSNTIYVFVSIGGESVLTLLTLLRDRRQREKPNSVFFLGYFGTDRFLQSMEPDPSLPSNTAVAVGYSTPSLLVLIAVSVILIFVPALLSLKRLPPNITNPGSNSLALSAACHCSRLSHALSGKPKHPDSPTTMTMTTQSPSPSPTPTPSFTRPPSSYLPLRHTDDTIELQTLSASNPASHSHSLSSSSRHHLIRQSDDWEEVNVEAKPAEEEGDTLAKLAQSEIRWGVVAMPPEWRADYDDGAVEHLGFGVAEDGVGDPVEGRAYA